MVVAALAATVLSGVAGPGAVASAEVRVAALPALKPGSKGPYVRRLENRLKALKYDPGVVDGKFGQDTAYAVWAFKKVHGLKVNATVGAAMWRALAHPRQVRKFVTGGAANRVEIKLSRQLVVVYRDGKVRLITHTSTGAPSTRTPTGNFRVERKIKGWRHAPLGYLYNPVYFYRGYALHGSTSVPLYPASHGCARLPMHTADIMPKITPIGMRVYVRK